MPSVKVLEKKKQAVVDLTDELKEAKSIILADYRGLTVTEDNEMRATFKKEGITYKVIKNSITSFAVKNCNLEGLDKYLNGPTAIAMSKTDLVAPAKFLSEYAKKYDKFELKAGVVEGEIIDVDGIKQLAELPSKEELIARLLRALNAPMTGLVQVLNANTRNLAVVLNAIAEKKSKEE